MRLTNKGIQDKGVLYRVVLDTNKVSTNYIERTRGVFYNEVDCLWRCSKCKKEVNWVNWTSYNHAKNECDCGQLATITILSFDTVAVRRG